MKISVLKLLAITLLLQVATAHADDFRVSSSNRIDTMLQQQEEDIGQLRTELASLRRELANAVSAPEGGAVGYSQPNNQPSGGSPCVDTCGNTNAGCNSGCYDGCGRLVPLAYQSGFGWYGLAETLIVKPFGTLGTGAQGDFHYTATPRLTLGRVGDSGFGVRARYWTFNEAANTDTILFAGTSYRNQIQAHVADIEATDRMQLGKWILTGSLGLRYVNFLDRFSDPTGGVVTPGLALREKSQSWGIVGGLGFLRPFSHHWSFFGNARYSVLTGQTSYSVAPTNLALHSTTASIAELGAGLQYNRLLWNGMNFTARGGYEAQYWNGFGDILTLGQATTFAGLTFGAGLNY